MEWPARGRRGQTRREGARLHSKASPAGWWRAALVFYFRIHIQQSRSAPPGERRRSQSLFGIKESTEDDMDAPGGRQAVGTAQKKACARRRRQKPLQGREKYKFSVGRRLRPGPKSYNCLRPPPWRKHRIQTCNARAAFGPLSGRFRAAKLSLGKTGNRLRDGYYVCRKSGLY
jgi:hypothetical protein